MSARDLLVRLLRLDPDGRVAAMRVALRDARARTGRVQRQRNEALKGFRSAVFARDAARAELDAVRGAAEVVGHLAQDRDDRITRALHVLADDDLARDRVIEAARRVLAGEPADPAEEEVERGD